MPSTKVVNQTGSSIILKEGTGGVYRMLCSNLQHDSAYTIKVDTNATYREYWCAVTPDDEKHVVLSSDDCMEYREVRIKLKADRSYTWDAVKRNPRELVLNAGDRVASQQPQAQAPGGTGEASQQPGGTGGVENPRDPSVVSKLRNKVQCLIS